MKNSLYTYCCSYAFIGSCDEEANSGEKEVKNEPIESAGVEEEAKWNERTEEDDVDEEIEEES